MQDNATRCRLRWAVRIAATPPTWLDPISFLRKVDPVLPGAVLPMNDDATSDSIAARVAIWLNAELVMLKSCELDQRDWLQAQQDGLVDRCFPNLARQVPRITWVNLREFRRPALDKGKWRTWQAFGSDGCVTLTTKDQAIQWKVTGQLAEDARLLYEFDAATGEEASTIHHERQGWEPYRPIGEPALCPNRCGSYYYPHGSGDCPVCGHIG